MKECNGTTCLRRKITHPLDRSSEITIELLSRVYYREQETLMHLCGGLKDDTLDAKLHIMLSKNA